MSHVDVELVAAGSGLSEGPLWDDRRGVLWWVDILGQTVHRLDPRNGDARTFELGDVVSALLLREAGGVIVAAGDSFLLFDPFGKPGDPIATIGPEPGRSASDFRLNEAKCDSAGRIWGGTMSSDLENLRHGDGALYCVALDGTVRKILTGVGISNGLDWSPDDLRMYFIDSLAYGVDEFDFDVESGQIFNRRRLITFTEADGLPDGLTVDADGYLWVAVFRNWLLRRFAPDGKLDDAIQLPMPQATSCCFGGPDLDELYITSYRAPDTPPDSDAGGVFKCRPGVTGLPTRRLRR